jgi:hypothetical protein
MSMWRRRGFSSIRTGLVGLAILLPGCGAGGGSANTTGPNPEVEIVPPKDEQGNTFPITDDAKTPG